MSLKATEIEKAICKSIDNFIVNEANKSNYKLFTSVTNKVLLFIGYNKNGKLVFLNEEGNLPHIYLSKDKDKFKITSSEIVAMTSVRYEDFFKVFDIKVKSAELSGKVFGKTSDKEKLIGKTFKYGEFDIDEGKSLKLDSETFYCLIPSPTEDKKIKFVFSDLEIIFPNIKGYNLPKDKTIKKGSIVVLKRDDNKQEWKVINIDKSVVDNSPFICKNSSTREKDIITIDNKGIIKRVYAKNLKLV